jgi:hypothetical protein
LDSIYSIYKKVGLCILAAILVLALTWFALGESPLSTPAELPIDSQTTAPAYTASPQTTAGPQESVPTTSAVGSPSTTAANSTTTTKPATTTAAATTAGGSALPQSAGKAEAVKLYIDAIAKAKSASGFTATRTETADVNIHTGERVQKSLLVYKLDFSVDDFFHDFVANPRSSSYQYSGGTWSLSSQRNKNNLLTNKQESVNYYEYGTNGTVSYRDEDYWNLNPTSGSGVSVSAMTSTLRSHDALKMTSAATPANFLPPASFSAADVTGYSYQRTSSGAELSFTLANSAIDRGINMPDTNAIRTQPFVYDAGVITVTMTFNKLKLDWQSPKITVTLNESGFPTSIKQTATLGSASECSVSMESSIISMDNLSSNATGSYSISWKLSDWNKTATPGRPF